MVAVLGALPLTGATRVTRNIGQFSITIERDGSVLAANADVALTWWQRFRGLMLRGELPAGCGLHFPGVTSVHTFFMRFPIDLVFLDSRGCVVKLVASKRPWGVSFCMQADGVLELPAGRAAQAGLCVGDRLVFEHVTAD